MQRRKVLSLERKSECVMEYQITVSMTVGRYLGSRPIFPMRPRRTRHSNLGILSISLRWNLLQLEICYDYVLPLKTEHCQYHDDNVCRQSATPISVQARWSG